MGNSAGEIDAVRQAHPLPEREANDILRRAAGKISGGLHPESIFRRQAEDTAGIDGLITHGRHLLRWGQRARAAGQGSPATPATAPEGAAKPLTGEHGRYTGGEQVAARSGEAGTRTVTAGRCGLCTHRTAVVASPQAREHL